jgi:putative phosphonate metabolism protein
MTRYPRYAIYYAPTPDHRLHAFGSQLLGYDAFSGNELPFPAGVAQAFADWRELTLDPRKYGFHATLKAPFSLASDQTERALYAACDEFAAMARRIPVIAPVVGSIEGFVAVIPSTSCTELTVLARDCVADFDHFRAPLTEDDRRRRNPSGLTASQRDNLERWGYPYVMDEFRFHMTLTGRLSAPRRDGVLATLRQRFAALDCATLAIDRIALFRQDDVASRFAVIGQFALRSARHPVDPTPISTVTTIVRSP